MSSKCGFKPLATHSPSRSGSKRSSSSAVNSALEGTKGARRCHNAAQKAESSNSSVSALRTDLRSASATGSQKAKPPLLSAACTSRAHSLGVRKPSTMKPSTGSRRVVSDATSVDTTGSSLNPLTHESAFACT